MTPFRVEFIRFDHHGAEVLVARRELRAQTVFDAEREALRVADDGEAPSALRFDAAFLRGEGPRVRRYDCKAGGFSRWGRA